MLEEGVFKDDTFSSLDIPIMLITSRPITGVMEESAG